MQLFGWRCWVWSCWLTFPDIKCHKANGKKCTSSHLKQPVKSNRSWKVLHLWLMYVETNGTKRANFDDCDTICSFREAPKRDGVSTSTRITMVSMVPAYTHTHSWWVRVSLCIFKEKKWAKRKRYLTFHIDSSLKVQILFLWGQGEVNVPARSPPRPLTYLASLQTLTSSAATDKPSG